MFKKIVLIILNFMFLYFIAFIYNRRYRNNKEDILFINKSQWVGILIMYIPILIAILLYM